MSDPNGLWRSLVARLVRDEEVPGSNPGNPTIGRRFRRRPLRVRVDDHVAPGRSQPIDRAQTFAQRSSGAMASRSSAPIGVSR